jgi:hypothetical protein
MSRARFHALAAELNLPVFWLRDESPVGSLQPSELEVYWNPQGATRADWVSEGAFTPHAAAALASLVRADTEGTIPAGLPEAEQARRQAVREELGAASMVMVQSDLRGVSVTQRAMAKELLEVGRLIEGLHARQRGMHDMAARIPADDPASHALLFRNQTVDCLLDDAPACAAVTDWDGISCALYPASVQQEGYCERIEADQPELMDPFVVVREGADGTLFAEPYHEAWPEEMGAVADRLEVAAGHLAEDEEPALRRYLLAAAKAFRDGSWFEADEAWSAMGAANSAWFVRVAPDDPYWEACHRKAAFEMILARVNPRSVRWQERLSPEREALELEMARLTGHDYAPRDVSFDLPDFVEITINAGDARAATGGTIGLSLPNWGPMVDAGSRTIVTTNLFRDPDTVAAYRRKASSVLCPQSMVDWTDNDEPLLLTTLLHEASHGLGPSRAFEIDGKTDEEIFGGALAGVLEELKAQVAAMHLTAFLVDHGVVDDAFVRQARVNDVVWNVGKIFDPMFTPDGQPRPYAQLSVITLGRMVEDGAITWRPSAGAADTIHQGCLEVHHDKMGPAAERLATDVMGIKVRGDVEAAKALVAHWVNAPAEGPLAFKEDLRERWLAPQEETLVYSVEL